MDNRQISLDTLSTSYQQPSPSMSHPDRQAVAAKMRAYRRRLEASGGKEVIFQLPNETIALLDEIKQSQGLRSRSQVLLRLIEQGRATAQHVT